MANEGEMKKFLAEFEALKAKYSEAITDLKVVRFTLKERMAGTTVQGWQDFVPFSCTTDEQGLTTCEEERPI